MSSDDPTTQKRSMLQLLFRKQNKGLFIAVGISILLCSGAPSSLWMKLQERRCEHACSAYMRGEPEVQWVADHANGAGYSALLKCMNDAMVDQQGYDCWSERVHGCTQSCLTSP